MSQTALGETAPGKVVNLLSNDVSRFEWVTICMNSMWTGPLLSLVIAILLWREIGIAGLVGIAIIFVVVPIQSMCRFEVLIILNTLQFIAHILNNYKSNTNRLCW